MKEGNYNLNNPWETLLPSIKMEIIITIIIRMIILKKIFEFQNGLIIPQNMD